MSEEEVKKGNLKIHVFSEFPYEELKVVLDGIAKLGYDIIFAENGNIVCQRKQK